ncbi:hypothetical protein M0805_006733 [Coniferiporia weirii]|nr:hypothetical protein M0805_006733 [Coniferiporia weirii]
MSAKSTPTPRLSGRKHHLQMVVEIPSSPFHQTPALRSTLSGTPISKSPHVSTPTVTSRDIPDPSRASVSKSLKRKLDVFVEIPSPLHRTVPVPPPQLASVGAGSVRRKLQVLVEIPPSPLHSARVSEAFNRRLGIGMKGSPLSSKAFNSNTSVNPELPIKKPRLADATRKTKNEGEAGSAETFPNGYFYCHQCRKKLDNLMGLRCTVAIDRRCKVKYCDRCIKNRYGQDVEVIRKRGVVTPNNKHVADEAYTWTCPRCAGECNCCRCRKAKGLEPTGKLAIRESGLKTGGGSSIWQTLSKNAGTGNPLAVSIPTQPVQMVARLEPTISKPRTARPKKVVREPRWSPVPTTLDRSQVEDRLSLREFLLRFSPLMNISTTHLESLDIFDSLSDACAKALTINLLDLIAADAEPEEQKIIKEALKRIGRSGSSPGALWANVDALRKALPHSALPVLISEPGPLPSTFVESESESELKPQPQRASSRIRTRGASATTSSTPDLVIDPSVKNAIQLVPPLLSLCECVLQGASARLELENGLTDAREVSRTYYTKKSEGNERWAAEKAGMMRTKGKENGHMETTTTGKEQGTGKKIGGEKEKAKDFVKDDTYHAAYKAHNESLAALDHVHTLALQGAAPRFAPLGRDAQGRLYYAASAHRRIGKRSKVPSEEERAGLSKWGWFLAVWGRGSMEARQEKTEERWWGFGDPAEIKQRAKWITATEGLDVKDTNTGTNIVNPVVKSGNTNSLAAGANSMDGDSGVSRSEPDSVGADRTVTRSELKTLVKGLNEYAELLAWRIGGVEP